MIHKKLKINLTKFLLVSFKFILIYMIFIKGNINFIELILFIAIQFFLLIVNIKITCSDK